MPTHRGSVRLFRLAGIQVFLHWSWLIVALFEISSRAQSYASPLWNVAEYVALFALVTAHEFGHAFACRSVGGRADRIVLWPLGGVAYVQPPERPGAVLWSIAAGPLVNVALLPVLGGTWWAARGAGWPQTSPHAYEFLRALFLMDAAMLVFNLLPVYPLDGGKILRSLLWYLVGPVKSLKAATVIGFAGALGLLALAVAIGSVWLGIIAAFAGFGCLAGLRQAGALERLAAAPRRDGFACPACRAAPPVGEHWRCGACRAAFDTFATGAACPRCGRAFTATMCVHCGVQSAPSAWTAAAPAPVAASAGGPPPLP